jgi:epoxyqueuosine reductase
MNEVLADPLAAYVSRYALGRDYHKLLRSRLQKLADKIQAEIGVFGYRVFTDSAPVMEKALAEKAGLGWIGKHSNLINRKAGSWFFLGEIYTDLPLSVDAKASPHCGDCTACLAVCPTQAIVAPYQVDARLCVSYLTIELHGAIRQRLNSQQLLAVFDWDEPTFLAKTEGSAIRRIGHHRWLRNIAVALGNARASALIIEKLQNKLKHPSELVQEHVHWALTRQTQSVNK